MYKTLNKHGLERRKGIFAYEWLDSLCKLIETQLPPKQVFYSKLKQFGITDEENKQALDYWREVGRKTVTNCKMLF